MSLILMFLLLTGVPYGQCSDKWRAGSALTLNGKIYVLTVFISETEWDYNEKKALYDRLYEAEEWLVEQAGHYGKTLVFEGGEYGLNSTVIMDHIAEGRASGNEPVDLVSNVLRKVGYPGNTRFVEWVRENTGCDNFLVLIFADKAGTGYSMACSSEMDMEKYFLEGCILYKNYSNNRPLASASIAHEILHLFGAWDLYATFSQTKDREEKARQLFPNDVMLRVSYNIRELNIGPLTAWLTGLSDRKEDWFEWFRPRSRDEQSVRKFLCLPCELKK